MAWTPWRREGRLIALLALTSSGCLYDGEDRCSPGEKVNSWGFCVCLPGHAPISRGIFLPTGTAERPLGRRGCAPCAGHEIIQGDRCVCEPGYVANGEGTCVATHAPEVNYGAACNKSGDCTGPGATCIDDDVLAMQTRSAYCSTRGCRDVSECPAQQGYGCFVTDGQSLCRKPADGEGDACDMNDGTESNPACTAEATACAFGRCTAPYVCRDAADCTPGLICCDLSAFAAPELKADAFICTTSDACITD